MKEAIAEDAVGYFSDNVAYGIGDALTLHGMLRLTTPARVIEIGSGSLHW
jgi:hypothetical protein